MIILIQSDDQCADRMKCYYVSTLSQAAYPSVISVYTDDLLSRRLRAAKSCGQQTLDSGDNKFRDHDCQHFFLNHLFFCSTKGKAAVETN